MAVKRPDPSGDTIVEIGPAAEAGQCRDCDGAIAVQGHGDSRAVGRSQCDGIYPGRGHGARRPGPCVRQVVGPQWEIVPVSDARIGAKHERATDRNGAIVGLGKNGIADRLPGRVGIDHEIGRAAARRLRP